MVYTLDTGRLGDFDMYILLFFISLLIGYGIDSYISYRYDGCKDVTRLCIGVILLISSVILYTFIGN